VKNQLKKRRVIPVALALLVLVIGSGVAYAYWTATGAGSGTGHAAPGETTILHATSAGLADMYPGDSLQDIVITVTNTSSTGQSAYATSVVVAVTSTTDPVTLATVPGCTALDFTVTGSPVTVNTDIAAGTSVDLTVANGYVPPQIQFNDTGLPQNACKGVVVHLGFTIS
jgi:hypothetical protein